MFNFLKHCQAVFQSGCTILHSFWLCVRVPVPPHFHQHFVWSVFSIWVILIDVRWYSFVLFTCISLMTKWYWVFFKVLAICISFIKLSIQIFHTFLLDYFLILEFWEFFIYYIYRSFIRYMICRCFLWVCGLSLHSFNSIFWRVEVLSFVEGQFIILWIVLLDMTSYLRNLCLIHIHKDFPIFFSKSCIVWHVHLGLLSI